jgi:hypothetical protein
MGYQNAWPRIRALFPHRRIRTGSIARTPAPLPPPKPLLIPVLGGPEEGGISWVETRAGGVGEAASEGDGSG